VSFGTVAGNERVTTVLNYRFPPPVNLTEPASLIQSYGQKSKTL